MSLLEMVEVRLIERESLHLEKYGKIDNVEEKSRRQIAWWTPACSRKSNRLSSISMNKLQAYCKSKKQL